MPLLTQLKARSPGAIETAVSVEKQADATGYIPTKPEPAAKCKIMAKVAQGAKTAYSL